jgi:RimJ/RimL family protein N-acetyltransferase
MITEESFVDFKCPYCGEPVSFPHAEAGLLRECPSCMEGLLVPADGSETGGKIPVPITAPRLVLRRFQPGDWKGLLELMPEAGEDYVLNWLENDRQVRLTTPEHTFYLGVELREGGKLSGYLSLRFTEAERRQALVDARWNPSLERADLTLEAMDALLGFCFEGLKLHRVTATCDTEDAASRRLYEELGMRREAEFIKDKFVEGRWASSVWYAALEEDYGPAEEKTPGQPSV